MTKAHDLQDVVPTELGDGTSNALSRSKACVAGKEYMDRLNAGRFSEVGALFAEKVDYVGPDGVALDTRDEVAKVYELVGKANPSQPPQTQITRLTPINTHECFMEFAVYDQNTEKYGLLVVDHFIVDDEGKIIWFRPYFQQPAAGIKLKPS